MIYEQVTETPLMSQYQPDIRTAHLQRLHSADFESPSTARIPISVTVHHGDSLRQSNGHELASTHSSLFDQFARSTHRQLEAMHQRTLGQIQAHQQWIANQWPQPTGIPMPTIHPMTTPVLIVNHPPVTMTADAYAQREAIQQELCQDPHYFYPYYT